MRYRDAKKLHNGDEVTVKTTGEIRRVLSIMICGKVNYDGEPGKWTHHVVPPWVEIKTVSLDDNNHKEFFHDEVK